MDQNPPDPNLVSRYFCVAFQVWAGGPTLCPHEVSSPICAVKHRADLVRQDVLVVSKVSFFQLGGKAFLSLSLIPSIMADCGCLLFPMHLMVGEHLHAF